MNKKTVFEKMWMHYLGAIFVVFLMLVAFPWLYFEANAQTLTPKPKIVYANDYIVEIVCPNGTTHKTIKVNSWRIPELTALQSGHSSINTYNDNRSILLPVGWYCNISEVAKTPEKEE